MVFNSNNIFDSTTNQASNSQASFNGGEAQNMEAPIYTQAFDAVTLRPALPPLPYPTPAQDNNQPANQNGNPDLEQLSAISQLALPTANQDSAPAAQLSGMPFPIFLPTIWLVTLKGSCHIGLLCYIPYNLVLRRIITGRWGPAVGTLLLLPPNVNSMPVNIGAVPTPVKAKTHVLSQCPEFYA
ncbi:hypothetical protein DSO57_1026100 [Entomophthora muscae]|uniref:Uncharacterized protein n=1 Tax=Entomophthora muscae TaxID=34485 RepID=A0ACC2RT23_9FUNG|nr:hypothetical protein DSO57_1026100 [Entomophthora muscae]